MKTLRVILILFTATFIMSCTVRDGRDGIDGEDGDALLGSIFEIEGDFTFENAYTLIHDFPLDFEIYDGDVVLVYILWAQVEQNDGSMLDIWRALPQTRVFEEGILQYNFDYTLVDVQIFLDGDIDFEILSAGDTHNQIFRIAVLPAAFAYEKSLNMNNLNSLMNNDEVRSRTIQRTKI